MRRFISDYNAEVHRHKAELTADWPDHLKWSRDLKQDARRGSIAKFEDAKIRQALYRPFAKRWLFFDRVMNEEVYQWLNISGAVIWVKVGSNWPFFALISDVICDVLPQGGSQCFRYRM
jgi:predicted helicase